MCVCVCERGQCIVSVVCQVRLVVGQQSVFLGECTPPWAVALCDACPALVCVCVAQPVCAFFL